MISSGAPLLARHDHMDISWRGVYPAVTTLFRDDQSLDVPATSRHVERLLAAKVHGLIMVGTVGENCSLEAGEKHELLAATVKHVAGRVVAENRAIIAAAAKDGRPVKVPVAAGRQPGKRRSAIRAGEVQDFGKGGRLREGHMRRKRYE